MGRLFIAWISGIKTKIKHFNWLFCCLTNITDRLLIHIFLKQHTRLKTNASDISLTLWANMCKSSLKKQEKKDTSKGKYERLFTSTSTPPACSLPLTAMATSDKQPRPGGSRTTHPGISTAWGHSGLMGKSVIREPFTSRRYPCQTSHLVPQLLITVQVGEKNLVKW